MTRLWDKGEPVDDVILEFCVGDDHRLDQRLVPYDVRASIAHATMLSAIGHLDADDRDLIERGLRELARSHADGDWEIALHEEDVHTALENRLAEAIGEPARRLHLGRSRNDQVLAALRLYLQDAIDGMTTLGRAVAEGLEAIERDQGGIPLPGYTHLQRAMPSSVALWAGGYRAEVEDDLEGLQTARRRVDKNPLGSAAGYGVPVIPLDRGHTTQALGFAEPQEPVTAVQLSRGKAEAGVLFEVTLLLQDLGRLAADLCLFASTEFGFVRLPHEFTTGSSIMPQKRNPDVFELVRGRSAQAVSELTAVLGVTSKQTSGYHRDLQLIKAPLFRGLDVAEGTLRVMAHALRGVSFDEARASAAMTKDLEATRRAYELVRDSGVPFRDAYRQIATEL